MVRELGELRRSLTGPTDEDPIDRSGYELALSTRRFSKRAKAVVDDKLAFSATLMRAGEVEAASRLLKEVQQEVSDERAVLMEKVHEVKIAQLERRARMTRMRLARTLAVAVLGSTVMAFSAIGMSVASFIADGDNPTPRDSRPAGNLVAEQAADDAREKRVSEGKATVHGGIKSIRINGKDVILSKSDMKLVAQFANGAISRVSVEEILQLLPNDLAQVIRESASRAEKPAEEIADVLLRAMAKNRKHKDKEEDAAASAPAEPSPEPSESPSPSPSPEPEPTPTSTDEGGSGGNNNKKENDDNSNTGTGSGTSDSESPLGGLTGDDEEDGGN